jgi:SAM-dependent methyltransferase
MDNGLAQQYSIYTFLRLKNIKDSHDPYQKEYWENYKKRRRTPEHPAVRALYEPRAKYLRELVPNTVAEPSILDVGSGNGFLTYYLDKTFHNAVGLDSSDAMLAINPCRNKICGSVLELPFEDNSFDVVVESHLLHHLEPKDVSIAIKEMTRVSKHHVVIYEPNRNNPLMYLFALIIPEEKFARQFSRRFIEMEVAKTGVFSTSSRLEGALVPNKTPANLVSFMKLFENTFVTRYQGF